MSRVRRVILAGMVSVLLCASAAVSAGTVSVQPFCMAKEAALVVHTVIDIEYSYPEGQVEGQRLPERQRQVLRIDCNKRTGECDAAALSVVGLEKGRPISALDLIPISGMKVVSAQGNVYTLAWDESTFTVNLPRKKVEYHLSSSTLNGAGEGPCD